MTAQYKRLTDADRAEIERLALSMKAPTPGKIARKLGANGRLVHRYKREHDERICELRRDGKNSRQTAEIVTAEFGIPRSRHSVDVRLTMLAAYSDGPESEAA